MSVVEKSIGELLVDNGQISADELRLAEREARSTGEPLSVILSRLGLAYEHHFKNALELKYGVTYVSLARTEVQPDILKKVPEAKLREHMMVPVHEKGSRITVVMVNPEHTSGLAALKEYFTDRQFTPVVCTEDDFTLFMANLYHGHLDANPAAKESNGASEDVKAEATAEPKAQESLAKPVDANAQEPAADPVEETAKAIAQPANASETPSVPAAESRGEEKPPAKPLSPLAAFLAKGKEMQDADSISTGAPAKAEFELPTNDETGKFDLNMLQKHIEQTRSKSGKKTAEEPAAEASKLSTSEIRKPDPVDEKPMEIEAAKPAIAESKPEPEPETQAPPSAKPEPEPEAVFEPDTKPEPKTETKPNPETKAEVSPHESKSEPVSEAKTEAKREKRPDARDVARELAKELAEEAKSEPGASRNDEATGEFDALVTTTMEKREPGGETKPDAKEETAQEVEPPQAKDENTQEPDLQEKTAAMQMDQTGEEFKAVSSKSTGEGTFGECEPVASESVARTPQDQKPSDALEKEGDDAAVIMLCNQILANGIAKGASTIHVEVVDKQVLVHYRIQGQLMIVRKLPKMLMPALTARFRKMGRVDQQDRRLPQDGRVKVRMSGKDFNLRLTVVPHTAGGEHILVWIE